MLTDGLKHQIVAEAGAPDGAFQQLSVVQEQHRLALHLASEPRYAIRNRDLVGLATMMWSSDYPHTGADWPNSRTTIDGQMHDVPQNESKMLLHDNALKLYGITDDKSVKLTVELPANVHRDLLAYAAVLARETGQPISDPSKLVAPMLMRFMAADRAFGKARRMNQPAGEG